MNLTTELVLGAILLIVIIVAVLSAIVIVPAGYNGVLLNYGAVTGVILPQGLHLITPVVQSVQLMNIRTQLYSVSADSASQDLQEVATNVGLNYYINPQAAAYIYKNYGPNYQDVIIAPQVQESIKATTANYTASELIDERPLVKEEMENTITQALSRYNISVTNLAITNFSFSSQYTAAIEAKVVAQQQLEQQLIVLNTTKILANQTVARAKGNATADVVLAEGNATAKVIQANATAEAAAKIQAALSQNPQYLRYLSITEWNGKLPGVVVGSGASALPLIQLNSSSNSTT